LGLLFRAGELLAVRILSAVRGVAPDGFPVYFRIHHERDLLLGVDLDRSTEGTGQVVARPRFPSDVHHFEQTVFVTNHRLYVSAALTVDVNAELQTDRERDLFVRAFVCA